MDAVTIEAAKEIYEEIDDEEFERRERKARVAKSGNLGAEKLMVMVLKSSSLSSEFTCRQSLCCARNQGPSRASRKGLLVNHAIAR